MGQYHYIANLDKREFLHPHEFGDGLKLMEFGASGSGTMLGLALLLAASNGRGGGDWHAWVEGVGYHSAETYGADRTIAVDPTRAEELTREVPGRWAGDRIAIIGDYREAGDVPGFDIENDSPWEEDSSWANISALVVEAIELDYYTREERQSRAGAF